LGLSQPIGSRPSARLQNFQVPRPNSLTRSFTVTHKSRVLEPDTCAELDLSCPRERGGEGLKVLGGAPESKTGRKHEFRALSWSVDGIDPSVRGAGGSRRARPGPALSLNDWLNSTVGRVHPAPNLRNPLPQSHDVADVPQRLDSIARQIEQIARPDTAQ